MKDFAKSIRTGNKYEWTTRNGEIQYFDYSAPFGGHKKGSVEKTGKGYIGYKMNGPVVISKKEFATEEEAKRYVETGNKKVGNKAIVLKDGDVWVVLYANETKSKEFDSEEEARKFAASVGNSKVGNDSLITKDGRVNYPDKEIGEINILKRELEGLMRMAQSDKTHDYTKQIEALKKEISEKKNKYAVGNKRYFDVEEEGGDSRSFSSLSEAKRFADEWRKEGKRTIHIFEIEENDKDPDDFRIIRTHNESIDKQTWSLFKGLSKDAEKEVGNETAEEKKFGHVMREFDRGELKSSSGETVTNPEQAKAIAYSESEKVDNLKRARNKMAK